MNRYSIFRHHDVVQEFQALEYRNHELSKEHESTLENTCKRLVKYSHGISLVALNSAKYEPMMFSPEEIIQKPVRIIGKVVELRGKL